MECPKLLHLLICNLKGQKESFAQEGTKTSIQLRTNGEDYELKALSKHLQLTFKTFTNHLRVNLPHSS